MIKTNTILFFLLFFLLIIAGASHPRFFLMSVSASSPDAGTLAMPTAPGIDVRQNEKASIDVSNSKDGYIIIKYEEITTKALRVIIEGPGGTQYIYSLNANGAYEVFPLSDGNGAYNIGVYENTSGKKYATAFVAKLEVVLVNEFAPFLRPNQYVNYTSDSETVKKATELTGNAQNTPDKIAAIYNHVIQNISYDANLADSVRTGAVSMYVPDADATLKSGKGICLDYAAVMSAMLRSQGIPTKFVVGYVKNIYHAWIDTYTTETGWVNGTIYFDGKTWKLMDPTFASSENQNSEVMAFIGDGKNYTAKYYY